MNYDLAKKLKDAGFSQMEHGEGSFSGRSDYQGNNDGGAYCPTLSELIEACGGKLRELHNLGENGWLAVHNSMIFPEEYKSGNGATAKIAVANLWLNLNSKK